MPGTISLKTLVYLWTRDAKMRPIRRTENYVVDNLRKLREQRPVYSDKLRADMAERVVRRLEEGDAKANQGGG